MLVSANGNTAIDSSCSLSHNIGTLRITVEQSLFKQGQRQSTNDIASAVLRGTTWRRGTATDTHSEGSCLFEGVAGSLGGFGSLRRTITQRETYGGIRHSKVPSGM